MAETEYSFVNGAGDTITTRDEGAAAHMRFDLGFDEKKSSTAKGDAKPAEQDAATGDVSKK